MLNLEAQYVEKNVHTQKEFYQSYDFKELKHLYLNDRFHAC